MTTRSIPARCTVAAAGIGEAAFRACGSVVAAIAMLSLGVAVAAEPTVELDFLTLVPEYGKIIVTSDPTVITHTFQVGDMRLGMNANGGGFINNVVVPGGGPPVMTDSEARYGRGWQGSLRDGLHGGRYNPTQAGFRDLAGTPTQLFNDNGRLVIARYNMPLFSDAVFDFTKFEELAEDYPRYNDGLNVANPIGDPYVGDRDALDEPAGWTQDDEVRSEFDFEGFYENAGDPAGNGCSVLRFFQRYSYVRSPRAIYQFGPGATRLDGGAVYNEAQIAANGDLSAVFPGEQLATEVDLAGAIFTTYGIRLSAASGFTNAFWYAGGEWVSQAVTLDSGGRTFKIPGSGISGTAAQTLDYGFLALADGDDPATARGFALYVPMVEANLKTVVGLRKTDGTVAYRENRFTDCFLLFTSATASQVSLRARYKLRGMFAPEHGDPDVFEALESDQYVLYGTLNQILAAVEALQAELYHGGEGAHGTPRTWLQAYGLTNENSDVDGDGAPEWQEYRAGTDPRRAESVLAITGATMNAATNRMALKWKGVEGKRYSVLSASSLADGDWITNSAGISGIEPETTHTLTADTAEAVFRISVSSEGKRDQGGVTFDRIPRM